GRDDRAQEGSLGVLRHEPRRGPAHPGRRLDRALRGDHERLRACDRHRPPPVRLADDGPARMRRRPCAGAARGEPVRHPGEVRGRRVARGRHRLPGERARPGGRRGVTHRVALIPGDGVGPEVIREARRAVDALGLSHEWTELAWGSSYWREHGRMMPVDALETLAAHDATLLGAIGDPTVPDHVSIWGLVLEVRQGLDLWANVRPARLLEGVPCPLAGRGAADVDL